MQHVSMEAAKSSWDSLFFDLDTAHQSLPTSNLFSLPPKAEPWTTEEEWLVPPSMTQGKDGDTPSTSSSSSSLADQELLPMPTTHIYTTTPHAICTSPMAFWRAATGELCAFNDAFRLFVDLPTTLLQNSAFKWDHFTTTETWCDSELLASELRNSLRNMTSTMGTMKEGKNDYVKLDFIFMSGTGQLRHAIMYSLSSVPAAICLQSLVPPLL